MAAVGRDSSKLLLQLRDMVRQGTIRSGEFLPTIRDLSQSHGAAFKTIQRALKALEGEGLLVSEPRRGYRVQARAGDPNLGMPLAYLNGDASELDSWDFFHVTLRALIQRAADQQGWSLLGIGSAGRPQRVVMEQLKTAKVWGVLLDTVDAELLKLASSAGMPVVMLDAWHEQFNLDAVLQDNYRGAYLGAQHLLSRGHQRIGWLGAIGATAHSRERFAGAAAAVAAARLDFPGDLRFEASIDSEEDLREKARCFLARAGRPCACLAYWRKAAAVLAQEARAAGYQIGRDIELVGWAAHETWAAYAAGFAPGEAPPSITWSMAEAVGCALERLEQRRRNPRLPPMRMHVATTLKLT